MQISLFNGFADKNPKPITIREVVEIIRADQRLQVLTENHRRYRQFEEPCMEEELIATYLRVPYGDEVGEFLTATRIIELIGGAVKRPLSAKKVALCMNRLGFEQRRTKYSRGWNVIILTGNDIKEEQRLNAHRSAAE